MSGHSKWASIKHKKALVDARKGQAYTKLANLITLAVRHGGPDPETNFRLRLAIDKAKAANMPHANIDRSVQRGTGLGGANQLEEVIYEGYGPSGVAIMIEAATDNRNRTAAAVRSSLSKHGGRLGETGSVAYQFVQKGEITVRAADTEPAALAAIEAGAEDVDEGEGEITVYTRPQTLEKVKNHLAAKGYEIIAAEVARSPQSTVPINDAKVAAQLMKIMDALEELDDVTATYANFDIDPQLL
jgi:YebC/PmpR family DNA-binding regulatory protein